MKKQQKQQKVKLYEKELNINISLAEYFKSVNAHFIGKLILTKEEKDQSKDYFNKLSFAVRDIAKVNRDELKETLLKIANKNIKINASCDQATLKDSKCFFIDKVDFEKAVNLTSSIMQNNASKYNYNIIKNAIVSSVKILLVRVAK
jgi:hypothetical protein